MMEDKLKELLNRYFFALLLLSILSCCNTKDADLNKCLDIAEKMFTTEQKLSFASKEEELAISKIHFTMSLKFRNEILREKSDDSKFIINFFKNYGITSFDNISYIIFKCLHRRLNNEPLEFNNLINKINEDNRLTKKCIDIKTERAKMIFKSFKIGDTLNFKMKLNKYGDKEYAVYSVCPDSIFNNYIELKCKIVDKLNYNNSFLTELIWKSKDEVLILTENIKLGDTIVIDPTYIQL